jgi:hypothetical protein
MRQDLDRMAAATEEMGRLRSPRRSPASSRDLLRQVRNLLARQTLRH